MSKNAIVAVLAAVAVSLAGCDTGDNKTAAANPVAAPVSTAPAPAGMTPEQVKAAINSAVTSAVSATHAADVQATATQVAAAAEAAKAAEAKAAEAAKPQYRTVIRRVCRPMQQQVAVQVPNPPAPHNTTGMLIGGVLGALAGHNVGGGQGRTIATLGGAAAGAYAGDQIANNGNQQAGTRTEMKTVTTTVCNDRRERIRVN